jgi:radical SAM superfamily enzyme YgiQ (UPF0313 family)
MLLQNVDVLILCHSIISMRRAGPHRIATELRKSGYSCQIIDCCWYFDQDEVKQILDTCIGPNTKVVAWSSPYATLPAREQGAAGVLEYFKIQKHEKFVISYATNLNSKIKFAVGGPTSYIRQKETGIDAIFYGMCDMAFVQYLKFLEGKNPFFQYTVQEDKMIVQGDTYNVSWNFNDSVIEYRPEDNLFWGDAVSIEIARGCIFKCDFCAYPLNGKKNNDYIKYQQTLKQEFLTNYEQHGITTYIASDDTFNDNIVKLQMLADIAQSLPFALSINCYLRIDLLRARPEQYVLLKDIGLTGAHFGIESFNNASAKSIGKGLHPDKVIEELYRFDDSMPQCGTMGSFIVGLPHETKDTIIQSTEQILQPDFPLDNIYLSALVINPKRGVYLSEFEKNTAKYFQTRDSNPAWWHNGHFDAYWAADFSADFNSKVQTRQRVGGFQVATLHNYRNDPMRPLMNRGSLAKMPLSKVTPPRPSQIMKLQQYKKKLFDSIQ